MASFAPVDALNQDAEDKLRGWIRLTLRAALADQSKPVPGTGSCSRDGEAMRARILASTGLTDEQYAKVLSRLMTDLIRDLTDPADRRKFLDTLPRELLEDILAEMRDQRVARDTGVPSVRPV